MQECACAYLVSDETKYRESHKQRHMYILCMLVPINDTISIANIMCVSSDWL